MIFDSSYYGSENLTEADRHYAGSRYSDVHNTLFANAYYITWGGPGEPPLPVYGVTLKHAVSGLIRPGGRWRFQQAANRTVDSASDLRWGRDGRGFRRILHPNGVCLMGSWEIDAPPEASQYSGYFKSGSKGLVIARYSTCCTDTRRGHYRSLSMVGKLYPTTDPNHSDPLRPANFITQEDIGGAYTPFINDAELLNAPNTTPWRRGSGVWVLFVTAFVLFRADTQITTRQLYPIADLGKPADEPTKAPQFMRLLVDPSQPRIDGKDLDFREEVLAQIYDRGNPEPQRPLTFQIQVSDEGKRKGLLRRRVIDNWRRIGRIVFHEAVASYNGDFVIHFQHPRWRNDRNDARTVARPSRV